MTKTETLTARVRPDFKSDLKRVADSEKRSMSAMLEVLLDFYKASTVQCDVAVENSKAALNSNQTKTNGEAK